MKMFFLTILLLTFTNSLFSQSLEIKYMDDVIQKNFITTIEDSLLYSYKATARGEFVNNSFNNIELFSSVKFIEKAENHSIGYCTELCYDGFDEDFTESITYQLAGNASTNTIFRGTDGSDGFQIYLYPYPPGTIEDVRYPGVTVIRIRFMNAVDPDNDFIEFDVRFEISVDGQASVTYEIPEGMKLSPNPANDFVKLNVSNSDADNFRNTNVIIYDLLGNIVLELNNYNLNSEINISELAPGRYIKVITDSKGKTYSLPLIKN